jgi:hypothetical protein
MVIKRVRLEESSSPDGQVERQIGKNLTGRRMIGEEIAVEENQPWHRIYARAHLLSGDMKN